jgi:hypothetical protein
MKLKQKSSLFSHDLQSVIKVQKKYWKCLRTPADEVRFAKLQTQTNATIVQTQTIPTETKQPNIETEQLIDQFEQMKVHTNMNTNTNTNTNNSTSI